MSRSGLFDETDDNWAWIRWRGAVKSALRGHRGQAFLRELLTILDALPEPELAQGVFVDPNGKACAFGCVALHRGIPLPEIEPGEEIDREWLSERFDVAEAMAAEILWINDEGGRRSESDWERFERVRRWVISNLDGDLV